MGKTLISFFILFSANALSATYRCTFTEPGFKIFLKVDSAKRTLTGSVVTPEVRTQPVLFEEASPGYYQGFFAPQGTCTRISLRVEDSLFEGPAFAQVIKNDTHKYSCLRTN